MISLGQLLATLLLIGREIIYVLGAIILFRQWFKGKARYYTDLPFLFGLTMIIMCIYNPIEIYYVAVFPIDTLNSPFGRIWYLVDLNLIAFVLGINFIILLTIWFPKNKKAILGAVIGWIFFTETAILLSAFVAMTLMDALLVIISLPMYIIFMVTFFFSYYQRRLPNVNSLLIGLGMALIIAAQFFHSILGQMGIKIGGNYSDASWPAMILWMAGFLVMFLGFVKKAPYFDAI